MKYMLYILILLIFLIGSGCTMNFKSKELEFDSTPTLSYELESLNILKESGV